jgi:threonine/homoserine/homoserine lactone efflux protein
MPPPDHLAAFAVAVLVIAVVPGPAMLYITAQTLANGRQVALQAVLGVHLGCYLHVIAAAIGLSAVLQHAPALYDTLRIAGIAYLVWLGVGLACRQRADGGDAPPEATVPRRVFRDSVIVEVLNPKTALFFMAFLPQFVDATAALPLWLQVLALGTVMNLVVSAVELGIALLACNVAGALRGQPRPWLARRLCGSVLIGLGVVLALGAA